MDPIAKALISLWQGQQPLWVAFWVYGHFVYGLMLGAFIAMYKLSFDALRPIAENPELKGTWAAKLAGILGTVVNVVDWSAVALATIFVAVIIWRSAPNTELALWGYLARAYVVLFFVFVLCGVYLAYMHLKS